MIPSPSAARERSPDPRRVEPGELTPVHQSTSRRRIRGAYAWLKALGVGEDSYNTMLYTVLLRALPQEIVLNYHQSQPDLCTSSTEGSSSAGSATEHQRSPPWSATSDGSWKAKKGLFNIDPTTQSASPHFITIEGRVQIALKKAVGRRCLDLVELSTELAEAEAGARRPKQWRRFDTGQFLTGRRLTALPAEIGSRECCFFPSSPLEEAKADAPRVLASLAA
ncbi:hypothetical protein HPB50_001551 [Hyalomma asiaticum]|uniref:Uncharacterized protein n=1 Tax=Hyalomma asiaticum TaxID=266040 RepID=A0ACB7RWC3_HYAAI|nr:hypothetical protein HPB50_001551 [Hyalomma asiaticum]